jgi:uncharacterized damage-inducible protein DinB
VTLATSAHRPTALDAKGHAVDILDRLLGHDEWTTQQLMLRCRELTDAQLDQPFDIGPGSVRATLAHVVGNVEVWSDLMQGRPTRPQHADPARARSLDGLIERHTAAMADFAALARRIRDTDRLDGTWLDTLDNPPKRKTHGGAITHVVTHDMHHRAEILLMLTRLGVPDLPEGDALTWEEQARPATG